MLDEKAHIRWNRILRLHTIIQQTLQIFHPTFKIRHDWTQNVRKYVRKALHRWKMHSTQCLKIKYYMKLCSNASNMYILQKMLDDVGWKVWLKTNFIPHHPTSFFLLFENFDAVQTRPTFHPTSQNRNVGWNVGCVCSGLYVINANWIISRYPINFLLV